MKDNSGHSEGGEVPNEAFDKHEFFDKVSAINAKKDTKIEALQSENERLSAEIERLKKENGELRDVMMTYWADNSK